MPGDLICDELRIAVESGGNCIKTTPSHERSQDTITSRSIALVLAM